MYTCPECEQAINQASEHCPYCGADLTAPLQSETDAPRKKATLSKMVLLWGTLLVVLGAIAWFALPWRMAESKSEAESRARDALASVQEELAAFQASEGSFPASLESLGDRARSAAQKAQSVHYTLQYMPGKPDSDGRVKSYTLIAQAGNYGYLNFSTDETGVLHGTREDRAATTQDPAMQRGP